LRLWKPVATLQKPLQQAMFQMAEGCSSEFKAWAEHEENRGKANEVFAEDTAIFQETTWQSFRRQ